MTSTNVTFSPHHPEIFSILKNSSPRADGTLTPWEEKVRLAWPLLKEQFSRPLYFGLVLKLPDDDFLLSWLGSHWTDYPEPSDSFVPRQPDPTNK